jgi:hypothetical protein
LKKPDPITDRWLPTTDHLYSVNVTIYQRRLAKQGSFKKSNTNATPLKRLISINLGKNRALTEHKKHYRTLRRVRLRGCLDGQNPTYSGLAACVLRRSTLALPVQAVIDRLGH